MPKTKKILSTSAATDASVRSILDAAALLFSKHGFEAVSMSSIASKAGLSKANIFHHFGSKDALYLAVLRCACAQSTPLLEELTHFKGSFAERLQHFAQDHLAALLNQKEVSRLILREILESDTCRGRTLAEEVVGENFSILVNIIREGQNHGELRKDIDPAMVATLLIGADVFFFEAQPVLKHLSDVNFADDPKRYSTMLADMLLRGILA